DDLYTDEGRAERLAERLAEAAAPAAPLTDWSRTGAGGSGPDGEDFEDALTSGLTLKDHLEAQLALAGLDGVKRLIATVLIDAVDESGYLRADVAEVAARLGAAEEECNAVLCILQGFDPAGVFA